MEGYVRFRVKVWIDVNGEQQPRNISVLAQDRQVAMERAMAVCEQCGWPVLQVERPKIFGEANGQARPR